MDALQYPFRRTLKTPPPDVGGGFVRDAEVHKAVLEGDGGAEGLVERLDEAVERAAHVRANAGERQHGVLRRRRVAVDVVQHAQALARPRRGEVAVGGVILNEESQKVYVRRDRAQDRRERAGAVQEQLEEQVAALARGAREDMRRVVGAHDGALVGQQAHGVVPPEKNVTRRDQMEMKYASVSVWDEIVLDNSSKIDILCHIYTHTKY